MQDRLLEPVAGAIGPDVHRQHRWQTLEYRAAEERLTGTFLGEIVEFHAPTKVAFTETLEWLGVTVMEARPEYELVSTPSGTVVHHTAEGRLIGIFNVMKPVVAWMARAERRRTVRALKDPLEQGR